jgi:transposase
MSQRTRILTEIWGYRGWKVKEAFFENTQGQRIEPVTGYAPPLATVILRVQRQWSPRCAKCGAVGGQCHEQLKVRRWWDLPMSGRRVAIEYAPVRVCCVRCGSRAVEWLAWADPHQRQSHRLQQHLALDAFSMPLSHVATKYTLSWHTVRRAETNAILRWEATRPPVTLRMLGIDEKYLGRRNRLKDKYITIVSNLENGEPIWIGMGRREDTVRVYLDTLSDEQKRALVLVAMDMHRPFYNAIKADPKLAHVPVVHDPFHIMKRAGEAVTELRRAIFFRAEGEMRATGRGTRWLVLRAWERCSDEDRARLRHLFSYNGRLARAYQTVEALRETLRQAPDGAALRDGLRHILRRTEKRTNVPMRKLHDSLLDHWDEIIALGEHRPPAGRIEALNNNWESMVRRARGYRNLDYLLHKVRFVTANPVGNRDGIKRFLALGLTPVKEAA